MVELRSPKPSVGGSIPSWPALFGVFNAKIQQYIKEVIQEMKKVTWPTWEELKGSTLVVILFSIIMGFYIAGLDFGLSWIVEKFLGRG